MVSVGVYTGVYAGVYTLKKVYAGVLTHKLALYLKQIQLTPATKKTFNRLGCIYALGQKLMLVNNYAA